MTRLCIGCRARFTAARDHHRLCWPCWRADDVRRAEALRTVEHERVATLARTGIDFEVAYTLVVELGARIVGKAA